MDIIIYILVHISGSLLNQYFKCLHFQVVLSHLLPVLDRLLEKALKKPEEMLKDEALLLHLILGKYNEHSAAFLCTDQQSLDLFIKALNASQEIYKGICTFQIRALGQVRLRERGMFSL